MQPATPHRGRSSIGVVAVLVSCVALVLAMAPGAEGAGLLVADGGFGGVLEIKEQTVQVTINNGVAVTRVEQTFVNAESRQVEALYTFPVPKGASVADFTMWIDGKEMIGEVVEKERARQIYNSYKQQRRDPGLLEQVDYKTFEMRIFPIAAHAEQRVRLTYYQELDVDNDWATYVYPLATVTRRDINQQTTGKFAFRLETRSAVPIVALESPSHGDAVVMAAHTDNYHEASLETTSGDLSRDLVLAYQLNRPRTGIDLITSKEKREDGYFLLTVTAGDELAKHDFGMDYVFVLDISGSMARDQKLRVSRDSIAAFIDALGPEDRFELITFNVQPHTLFNQVEAATDDQKAPAAAFLDMQQARGGTVLKPAMATAYRYADPDRTLNVVVVSDGMTEQSERAELIRLIGERPVNCRVFGIGVGNEVNRPLMQQLAERTGGLAAFISRGDNFKRQARAFRRKLMRPAIEDVTITFGDRVAYDVEPQRLGNLYHGSPLKVYGRYRKSGSADVTITGQIDGRPIEKTATFDLPNVDAANPQIERMWAWHRVQRLLKDAAAAGSRGAVIGEVIELGETYSIATEYTSFIVLENDEEYQRWKIERRNLSRMARDEAARTQLRRQLDELREKAMADLGPAQPGTQVTPTLASNTAPADAPANAARPQDRSRSFDLDIRDTGDTGGGGALDPISVSIALGLGGAALAARRGRKRAKKN